MLQENHKFPKITYMELSTATNGFSASNLIGEGSYGCVYKGVLYNDDDKIVAVKVLNLKQRGAAKSFLAECDALKNIRHRNVTKIVTICSSLDRNGNEFKALVYKFMPNGNLDGFLHRGEDNQLKQGKLSLFWRLRLAIDIASGLEYLHHHCQTTIIHGDLKPSNVLIDQDFTACVGDFGLAKFLTLRGSRRQTSSFGIRGTVGYVAPEYGMGGKASVKGDVYSFGILVLELFTGKRPTDNMFTDEMDIHLFAKEALNNQRVTDVIDPSILTEARGRDVEGSLIAILKIGISCSMKTAEERMDIRQIAAELCKIRDKFVALNIKKIKYI